MKNLIIFLVTISLFACGEESKKAYVTLQGNIINEELDSILVFGKDFKKVIKVNEDGSFKDTLKVVDGFHSMTDGKQRGYLYLRNGDDMDIEIDMENFPESLSFEGQGSITNNYLVEKLKFIKNENLTDYAAFFSLDKNKFDLKLADLKTRLKNLLAKTTGLDEEVVKMEKESIDKIVNFFQSNYDNEHAKYVGLNKGDPSPKFNYPDQNGNKVSLDDLKGKYVYVDVWATWCGPCKKEIPFLKEMDKAYKGKDIEFVSLSIDKMEHKDKWLKMIKDEDLGGIQILADQDWNSEFITAYRITGIPRFILIDKEGNIVNSNAPRPSDPYLQEVLGSLSL